MKTIKEFKSAARQSLSGKWLTAALCTLVYFLIFYVAPELIILPYDDESSLGTSFYEYIIMMLLLPLYWGYIVLFLNVARDNSCQMGSLFHGFSDYGRIFGTMLLQTVYICLWTLLLIIPGIIKTYSYALTPYILKDNPELSFNGAIDKSMAMMKGHKMDLFLLDLSFIGWFILGVITLCIGFLWISPYWQTARTHFYLDLKAEQELQ